MSYNVTIRRKQGGDVLEVASGGEITIASGGSITVEDGGSITLEEGGSISLTPVEETTGVAMETYGMSICDSTKAKSPYPLPAPSAGDVKYVMGSVAAATGYVSIGSTASGVPFILSGSTNKAYLRATGEYVLHLVADTTAYWRVIYKSTTVAGQTAL